MTLSIEVPLSDLRGLFLALREQAKARAAGGGVSYVSREQVGQYEALAGALNKTSPIKIPNLHTPTSVEDYLASVSFAIDLIEALVAREESGGPISAEDVVKMQNKLKLAETEVSHKAKPTLFIGCSVEGLQYAEVIQYQLRYSVQSAIWSQGVFGLSRGTLETLVAKKNDYDYAVLVLTPDDIQLSRDESGRVARDNVIFELGLFMGALGRERVFMVSKTGVELPTDLAGISVATFDGEGVNLIAALGPVCTQLKIEMGLIG